MTYFYGILSVFGFVLPYALFMPYINFEKISAVASHDDHANG